MLPAAAVIVAAAIVWGALAIAAEVRRLREQRTRAEALTVAQLLVPAIAAAQSEPRVVLTWQPIAQTLRAIAPEAFQALDRAAAATFPFSDADIEAAHARWTAEWLSWERAHDAEYKARSRDAQGSRAQLDTIESERLDTYQRRYEEYIRVAKGLQALILSPHRAITKSS